MTRPGQNPYTGILFIQALEHPRTGTSLGENYKSTKTSPGLSRLLSAEPQAMYELPNIPYVIWEHGQGLTDPKHNQWCCPLKSTEHSSCESRFCENCKTTMPSSGWYMLFHKEQHTMDELPNIPHVLWVY